MLPCQIDEKLRMSFEKSISKEKEKLHLRIESRGICE
jgi:hypothetical protein